MPLTARAFVNSDDAFIAWKTDAPIPGLRGFALERQRDGQPEIVSTWVGWAGESAPPGTRKHSTIWPIQKFQWTDYTVRPGEAVSYRVVPMTGTKTNLQPQNALASGWTPPLTVGAKPPSNLHGFFNRGIVASQWLARWLNERATDTPSGPAASLKKAIDTPGDEIRNYLGGPVREELLSRLATAAATPGVKIYAALYELHDPELEAALLALGKRANVVLANGSVKKKGQDQNSKARAHLTGKINIFKRMVAPTALGHNKFCVFTTKTGKPDSVWTGSTNWTRTGLCTQANNALFIDIPSVAKRFHEQWKELKKSKDAFPQSLSDFNHKSHAFNAGPAKGHVWFTRVGDLQDLDQANALINSAKQGILFLMFNPGPSGTLLNTIIERGSPASSFYDNSLYIQGAVNQDPGTAANPVQLFHRGRVDHAAFDTVLPEAIDTRLAYWVKELKKLPQTFAMVHSKVIVLDPFGARPVVITGSHNLGPKASSKNDENMVIVQNEPALAAAYAVNIISIYNQYRWRYYRLRSAASAAFTGLEDNDTWQNGYYKHEKAREIDFWLGIR